MLAQRLAVIIVMIPTIVLFIVAGGWSYAIFIALVLAVAAWEYWRIFQQGGCRPSLPLLILGVVLLALGRAVYGFDGSDVVITGLVLLSMTVHEFGFERAGKSSATDFGITLGGIFYLGWLGAYFISLRNLPDGQWWLLLALPAIWLADAGAYIFGRLFGRHKISPRTSPNKTWEGYLGGIVFSAALTPLLAALWQLRAPVITPEKGLVMALALSVIAPMGDLCESMIKRQFGVKDSSNLLPGHGGIMDRIDTWLWAVALAYYLIIWLW